MSSAAEEALVRRAAAAAARRPAFLAWVFDRYREAEALDADGLADVLGIGREELGLLALCRRPRPDRFSDDLLAIANRFGVKPDRLALVIRQVEALAVLAEAPAPDFGVLAAARDREDADDEEGSDEP